MFPTFATSHIRKPKVPVRRLQVPQVQVPQVQVPVQVPVQKPVQEPKNLSLNPIAIHSFLTK